MNSQTSISPNADRQELYQLVTTIKDRCRVCFTCVRECPVKAIKIINGQAEVIHARCIGCGNCVKVCSQDAKFFLRSKKEVFELLEKGEKVAACVAPSFPAEFTEINDMRLLVGMIRQLGFTYVTEVAFGADMVAREYEKNLLDHPEVGQISSDCPAIVYFIRHYHPELVPFLTNTVSPMIAITRILREKHGQDLRVVFIGPCFAKKAESEEVDEVITFRELREMFAEMNITPEKADPSDFDPPRASRGALFPVSRGLLMTTRVPEGIRDDQVIVAEGRLEFKEAVKEFEEGYIRNKHLHLLCCEGCVMGPGMSPGGKRFTRGSKVNEYVSQKLSTLDQEEWMDQVHEFSHVDYSRTFSPDDRRFENPSNDAIAQVLKDMGKFTAQDHLNCGACGYDTCVEHAVAILKGLAETEMCLPFTIEKLHRSVKDLNVSNEKLATARQALIQSEKLAHMGQLSAGIAHELNNPLGIITMYSNILLDELPENDPLRADLQLIVEQTDRCKKIVGGLLNFARKNQVNLVETQMVGFVKHSMESVIKPTNVEISLVENTSHASAMLDQDQMMQVMTNLMKNAIEAMPGGGSITIRLEGNEHDNIIVITDTGSGISKENMDKIFTPFFTTKEMGKGTGLGLPLIYGIVKMHKGQITLSSNNDPADGPTGTTFTITLPRKP